MNRYNLSWPEGTPPATIELWCYKNNHTEAKGGRGKAGHMQRAIELLFPEKLPGGGKGFVISDWTERRIRGWCSDEFRENDQLRQTWWGPSTSGKSTDGAVILLTDWLSAPARTTTTIVSTTRDMLEQRIWGEMVKFYLMWEGNLPGRYLASKMKITLGDDNSKNCIRGIAVLQGSVKEAKNNIIGVHNDYNRLVVDEMQDSHMAVPVEAQTNLSSGCLEYRFLGMGNPESQLDPLGLYSEPVDGWDSVSPSSESWQTKEGKTLYFDGLKSPGIRDARKFYFLLGQRDIDDTREKKGEDSPQWWSMRRGFIPPDGVSKGVLTEKMLVNFKMREPASWVGDFVMVAGLDAAYAAGGDDCILFPAGVGVEVGGKSVVNFFDPIHIKLQVSDEKPMAYFIVNEVKRECKALGITPGRLAVDTTGTQAMLADIFDVEWGRGCMRVSFGGSASEMPASVNDAKAAKDEYANRVTELWFNMAEFGRHGQIRGLSDIQTCKEFVGRHIAEKGTRKVRVESKREMKKRTSGRSPDRADAATCVLALVRERMGMHPGGELLYGGKDAGEAKTYQDFDLDGSDKNYLQSALI